MHISELSNRFIKDPSEAVKTGQIIKAMVLSVDTKAKRIALSIKALTAPAARPAAKAAAKPTARPTPKPEATLDEKLTALSMKWKVR